MRRRPLGDKISIIRRFKKLSWKVYSSTPHKNHQHIKTHIIARWRPSDDVKEREECLYVMTRSDGGEHSYMAHVFGTRRVERYLRSQAVTITGGNNPGLMMSEAVKRWHAQTAAGLVQKGCPRSKLGKTQEQLQKRKEWASKSLEEKTEIRAKRKASREDDRQEALI